MAKFITQSLLITLCFFLSGLAFAETPAPPIQYKITIVSPQPEETFQNSTQTLPITVQVTPALKKGDLIVILVDGLEVADPSPSTSVEVPWLPRGSHTVQAKVIQKNGKGAVSDLVTFFQQRTSQKLPQR